MIPPQRSEILNLDRPGALKRRGANSGSLPWNPMKRPMYSLRKNGAQHGEHGFPSTSQLFRALDNLFDSASALRQDIPFPIS